MNTRRKLNHLVCVTLLLLWGAVLLYFYASGRLAKGQYVSQQGAFSTMVLVGGIGCIVVGLFNLLTMGVKEAHSADDTEETAGGPEAIDPRGLGRHRSLLEEHGVVGSIIAVIILAVPISYAAVFSPDGFKNVQTLENKGTYAETYQKDANAGKFELKKDAPKPASVAKDAAPVNPNTAALSTTSTASASSSVASTPPGPLPQASNASTAAPSAPASPAASAPAATTQAKSNGSFTLDDLKAQVERSPEGNFKLEVPEIYYTANDKEVQSVLTGQPIETVAQVIPEKVNNPNGTRVRIFRMLIQCCAADARPYSIPVEFGKTPPAIKEMSWVKVVGKMDFRSEGGQVVPVILATSMTAVPEPENKMVY